MRNFLSKFTKSSIISSVALFAFAILLIVQSEATIITISYVIGGILVAIGALAETKYIKNVKENATSLEVVYGAVCVILGVLVIKNPQAIAEIIPFVIGFIIIVNSAAKLQYSMELRKEKNKLWLSTLTLSVIMTICGIVLIFNPFQGAVFITRVIGALILIYAVLDLVSTFVIRRTFKQAKNVITASAIKEASIIEEKPSDEQEKSKNKEIEDEQQEEHEDEKDET